MRFNLLIFSFVTRHFLHRTVLNGRLNKNTDGCDHRYFTANETILINNNTANHTAHYVLDAMEDVYRFNCYFYKLKLLKKITNPRISNPEKLTAIKEAEGYNNESKYTLDLTSGGLFKDWDVTIL
jgi:hypothetical protein